MIYRTAQQLFVFAKDNPSVQRRLRSTFDTLAHHVATDGWDREKALKLVSNNVRDAARLYVQQEGLDMAWWRVFPEHEREGCASLILRRFEGEHGL